MVHYIVCIVFTFCFFKQKTAYEMRISDWSSDVCSSDLKDGAPTELVSTRKEAPSTHADRFAHHPSDRHERRTDAESLQQKDTSSSVQRPQHTPILTGRAMEQSHAVSQGGVKRLSDSDPPGIAPKRARIDDTLVPEPDRKSKRLNSSHYCASSMQ